MPGLQACIPASDQGVFVLSILLGLKLYIIPLNVLIMIVCSVVAVVRGASTLKLVETRRGREPHCFKRVMVDLYVASSLFCYVYLSFWNPKVVTLFQAAIVNPAHFRV